MTQSTQETLMSRFKTLSIALVTLTVLLFGVSGVSAAEKAGMNDLNNYLCKDVMRLSGEDREVSIALVHGYRLGKMGTTQFNTMALAEITDKFMDYCLDNPNEKALASFEKVAK
jgi:hypothetical protein